jgi:terminase, large subunit
MRTAQSVLAEARAALRPPPRLNLSAWADEKFYLSADAGAAEPGRWTCLPHQRAWMDAMTDPLIEQISIMKSARVGYTEVIKAFIGYHVDYDACPILVVQPTEDDAKGFSKESIEPMLRDVPTVGEKFAPFALKNSMLHKRFRGGVLQLAGARSPGNFRRVARRIVIGDEVDGYPPSAGREGDPIKLATRRSETFWNRKLVWGSTPTYAGVSRIEQLFLDGDQRRRYVPCPHCHEMQVLRFPQFRWPKGKPELAVYVCEHCGVEIEHAHKRDMVHAAEWRPGPHPQFPDVPTPPPWHGHASFHLWAAYSLSPNATWGQLCREFVDANAAGAEQLQTFVNTGLGETWQDKGEAPAWRRLYDRREEYAIGSCPRGVLFLTAGVDVQHDRLVYEVVGWGRGKESWSIDSGVIPGDTSNLTAQGPWPQIDALLERAFPHDGGAELRLRMLAVDSGDQTQTVYNWVRTKDPGRVMAVKGSDSTNVLVGTPSKVDVSVKGKRVGWVQLWRVGKPLATSELYGWLKLVPPTDEERRTGAVTPPGYCHFPAYGEDYFKQMTALQLVPHTSPKGFTVRVWELIPGREDHFHDSRRYARAAAAVVGLDRSKESDWAALERALGIETPPPTPAPDGTTPLPVRPRSAPGKPPWINRRPGGWLKGNR